MMAYTLPLIYNPSIPNNFYDILFVGILLDACNESNLRKKKGGGGPTTNMKFKNI
jgi:hypothetical protein